MALSTDKEPYARYCVGCQTKAEQGTLGED